MRWGFLFHFIAGFFFKQTFRVLLCILNEYCVNEPVAADLNVQRTTCWTRWTPLLVRESLSSLPAATRGWFHYHIQLLLSFKLNNVSPCSAFLRGQVSSRKLNSLLCSSSSPCVSFPFSLSARLSDVRCLLLVSGHRAVWNHRKAAGEWQYDWSFILGEFLIINTPLVHQGSRIDEQRCEFPPPLKVRLQSDNLRVYIRVWSRICVCFCVVSDILYEHHDISFPKQK